MYNTDPKPARVMCVCFAQTANEISISAVVSRYVHVCTPPYLLSWAVSLVGGSQGIIELREALTSA